MNELIEKLTQQANNLACTDKNSGKVYDAFAENLALLIAKECLALCTQHYVGAVGTYAGAHNSAVKKCADSIRERFGVEE